MTQERHFDVASYALGVLDDRDAGRFEEHLVDCPACGAELDSLLPVVDLLADVDADSLLAVEQSRRDGMILHRMIGEVGKERHRAKSRRLYTLAAAVIAFALLSVGSLFLGGRLLAPESNVTAQPSQSPLDPLPPTDGPGIGGPDLVGARLSNTDLRTGVHADVTMQPKQWGTDVALAVSNIKGPLTCRLVAVRRDSQVEVLATWTVGEKGWGTAARPEPLELPAVTALPRADIAHLQVQAVDAAGVPTTLVRVP